MARITRLHVENYRSIATLDLDLHPDVTLLVGPNGAGKSNIIDALGFWNEAMKYAIGVPLERRGGMGALSHRGAGRPAPSGPLNITIGWHGDQPHAITLEVSSDGGERLLWPDSLPPRPTAQVFDIETRALRAPQVAKPTHHLADDGSNLSHTWGHLQKSAPEMASRVIELLGQIVPGVASIRAVHVGRYAILEVEQTLPDGRTLTVDGAGLSDGTLRALAMLVAVYQPDPPDLIAIEEPEKALHPYAAELLFDALLSAPAPPQLLISTHSPAILTSRRLDLSMIRVVEWRGGETIAGPIAADLREDIADRLTTAPELLAEGSLRPEEPERR